MKVSIIAVGRRPPRWAESGFEEYAKRLPPHLSPKSILIDSRSRGAKRQQVARQANDEGEKMLQAAGDAYLIALDRGGRDIATEDVASALSKWQMDGRDIAFLIGGAEGLAPALIERADQVWSLSKMVFAHQLVRLLLVEQLYRGWSINEGSPYHRGEAVKAVRRSR